MAKREREAADMAAMVDRVLRSLVKRAEAGDMDALVAIETVGRRSRIAGLRAAAALKAEPWNYSWGEVGHALSITRQAAQQRFGGGTAGAEG